MFDVCLEARPFRDTIDWTLRYRCTKRLKGIKSHPETGRIDENGKRINYSVRSIDTPVQFLLSAADVEKCSKVIAVIAAYVAQYVR